MTKVAYNCEYGGFLPNYKTIDYIISHSNYTVEDCELDRIPRHDPILIEALEKYPVMEISIAEISGDRYWVWEYDGIEHVYTPETIPWVIINKED